MAVADDRFLHGALRIVSRMVSDGSGPPNLPRYSVGARLGEGAMAVVYRAEDRTLGRPVALKVLRESLAASEEGRDRFVQEARSAALLSHPNLVAVHDAGEHDGRPYLVMELVEGRPLSEFLRERSLPPATLLALIEKAARGVAAAHDKGLVHRDLKPANILVTASGEPKVADFGLARAAEPAAALTAPGTAVGTPLYMAPEQVRGEANRVGPWTDVYALGAVLYESLTGRPPHAGQSLVEIHGRVANDEPVPPRKRDPRVPRDVETICLKALEKRPERRYRTAREFAEDLRRHLDGEPVEARRAGAAERALRWVRRHRALSAAVAAAAASAVVFWALSGRSADSEVARRLLLQKRESVEDASRQREREGRDASSLDTALLLADQRMARGQLQEAASILDHALAVIALEQKLRDLRQVAEVWRQEGRDPSALRRIADDAERLVREGKLPEAMELMNRAATIPEGIHRKIQAVQRGVEARQREGRDASPVGKLMEQFEPLMREGRHAEAEALLDRALRLLNSP